MNWDEIHGNWSLFKGEIKERWGKLTDDDMDVIEGERDQLIGTLQKRYGMSKEQAQMEVEDYVNGVTYNRR